MEILSHWTYVTFWSWGEVRESGLAIHWEDASLRTGTLYIITKEEKLEIDTESKLNREQFLDLMSKLYDMAEVK